MAYSNHKGDLEYSFDMVQAESPASVTNLMSHEYFDAMVLVDSQKEKKNEKNVSRD